MEKGLFLQTCKSSEIQNYILLSQGVWENMIHQPVIKKLSSLSDKI